MIDDNKIEEMAAKYGESQAATNVVLGVGPRVAAIDFEMGARWAISELTRWRDPEVELPSERQLVLLLHEGDELAVGSWECGEFLEVDDKKILGWRPI